MSDDCTACYHLEVEEALRASTDHETATLEEKIRAKLEQLRKEQEAYWDARDRGYGTPLDVQIKQRERESKIRLLTELLKPVVERKDR